MPTGYTAAVADGITFEQFVWRCARAMGALVMMREEPTDAPIPERFEASDYSAKKLAVAKAELERLMALSPADANASAVASHAKAVEDHAKRVQERDGLRAKYQAMLDDVMAWKAPTVDHAGFKVFMFDQLKQSIDFDCCSLHDDAPLMLSGADWLASSVATAERNIEYHAKENADEIVRTESRNEWLRALRESLKKSSV